MDFQFLGKTGMCHFDCWFFPFSSCSFPLICLTFIVSHWSWDWRWACSVDKFRQSSMGLTGFQKFSLQMSSIPWKSAIAWARNVQRVVESISFGFWKHVQNALMNCDESPSGFNFKSINLVNSFSRHASIELLCKQCSFIASISWNRLFSTLCFKTMNFSFPSWIDVFRDEKMAWEIF